MTSRNIVAQSSTPDPLSSNWAAYAAAIWAVLFAALSFCWAAGGLAGADLVAPAAKSMAVARVPWFVAVLWATALLKLFGGLVALALVRAWGRIIPHWLRLLLAGGAGLVLTVYGVMGLAGSIPVLAGAITVPDSMPRQVLEFYVFLWQPYFLLGGILFAIATAIDYSRSRRLD